jgi:hypothetical protein
MSKIFESDIEKLVCELLEEQDYTTFPQNPKNLNAKILLAMFCYWIASNNK